MTLHKWFPKTGPRNFMVRIKNFCHLWSATRKSLGNTAQQGSFGLLRTECILENWLINTNLRKMYPVTLQRKYASEFLFHIPLTRNNFIERSMTMSWWSWCVTTILATFFNARVIFVGQLISTFDSSNAYLSQTVQSSQRQK